MDNTDVGSESRKGVTFLLGGREIFTGEVGAWTNDYFVEEILEITDPWDWPLCGTYALRLKHRTLGTFSIRNIQRASGMQFVTQLNDGGKTKMVHAPTALIGQLTLETVVAEFRS